MPSDFQTGITVYGMPVLPGGIPPSTGKTFFVSNRTGDSGSDGNDGLSAERPLSTLAAGVAKCSTGRGDVVIVMPGHAETISTTVTPIAGSAIVGLGWGGNKPTFTGSGAIAVFTASAANVRYQNLRVVGASASVDAHVALSGADNEFLGCEFDCRATPLHSIDVVSGAARAVWKDCVWFAGAGCAVDYIWRSDTTTATGANWRIINCYLVFSGDLDIDDAVMDSTKISWNGLCVNGLYGGPVVGGDNVTGFDFNCSTNVVDGMMTNVHIFFDAPVSTTDVLDAGGIVPLRTFFSDITSASGARFPATTAS